MHSFDENIASNRYSGAGFGGCAVALVEKENAQEFESAVAISYKQKSNLDASIYICEPSDGANIIEE